MVTGADSESGEENQRNTKQVEQDTPGKNTRSSTREGTKRSRRKRTTKTTAQGKGDESATKCYIEVGGLHCSVFSLLPS